MYTTPPRYRATQSHSCRPSLSTRQSLGGPKSVSFIQSEPVQWTRWCGPSIAIEPQDPPKEAALWEEMVAQGILTEAAGFA